MDEPRNQMLTEDSFIMMLAKTSMLTIFVKLNVQKGITDSAEGLSV